MNIQEFKNPIKVIKESGYTWRALQDSTGISMNHLVKLADYDMEQLKTMSLDTCLRIEQSTGNDVYNYLKQF